MNAKFSVTKTERLYITDEWLSNGHWAVKRDVAPHLPRHGVGKALRPLCVLQNGTYPEGMGDPISRTDKLADMNVFPKLSDEYVQIFPTKNARLREADMLEVLGFVWASKNKHVLVTIGPRYVPLLHNADKVMAKRGNGPIILMLHEGLMGYVMPVRDELRVRKEVRNG